MRARNKKEVSTLFAGSFVVRTIDINQLSLGIISDDPVAPTLPSFFLYRSTDRKRDVRLLRE